MRFLSSLFFILICITYVKPLEGSNISQKVCSYRHKDKLMFLCHKDNILLCEECAMKYHGDHIDQLETLSSVFLKFKMTAKNMKKQGQDSGELGILLKEKLRSAYDQFIRELTEYKNQWIKENFQSIFYRLTSESNPKVDAVVREIEHTYGVMAMTDSIIDSGFKNFKFPQEFEKKFENIKEEVKNEFDNLKVNLTFDKKTVQPNINYHKASPHSDIISLYSKYQGTNVNEAEFEYIISLLPRRATDMNLLFSTNRDGFSCIDFHRRCDGKEHTLTIIKSEGKVLGGYANPPWNSGTNDCIRDNAKESFLFSSKPMMLKLPLKDKRCAIYGYSLDGPNFGKGDLEIYKKHLTEKRVKEYYESPSKLSNADELRQYNQNNIDNYEVYQIIFQLLIPEQSNI